MPTVSVQRAQSTLQTPSRAIQHCWSWSTLLHSVPYCQHPLTVLAFCAFHCCSLAGNALCGINEFGRGTYNAKGITKLAEALKSNSSLRELKYVYSHYWPRTLT